MSLRPSARPALLLVPAPGAAQENLALGHPGYLVVAGAADDTSGAFVWQDGPGPRRRSLVWAEGQLTIPVDMTPETLGPSDLAVPCTAALSGTGHGGRLVFGGGAYRIDAPLLLSDGVVALYAAAGELETRDQRVLYRPPTRRVKDPRAPYLLLAGLVLLTLILLRRARRGFREGAAR